MINTGFKFIDYIKLKKFNYITSVLCAVISVFCGIIPFIAAYKLMIHISQGTTGIKELTLLSVVIVLGFLFQILFHIVSTAISHKTAFFILERIRLDITEKIIKMPLGYTQSKGKGHFKNMMIDEIERLEYPLAHAIPETTSSILLPISVTAILLVLDWRMGLAACIPAIATLLFYIPMYKGIMDEFVSIYYINLEKMNGKVIEFIKGMKEIKIFGKGKDAYSAYEKSIDNYRDSTLNLYSKMYFVTSPAYVLLSSILVSVLCIGGILYCTDEISPSFFILSIFLSVGIGAPLLKFTEFMDNFYTIKNGKRLIEEVMSAPELPQTEIINNRIDGKDIVFHKVSFSYDRQRVINNLSVIFSENEKTAIVGPSGAGKSTVANLIARYWDTDEGYITLGGVDIKDMPLSQLMENINYVTQDVILFNISIGDNIRIGKPDATLEEVKSAAKAAQCNDFILALDKGYDSVVGSRGLKLSGGEKQRIIIARAILRDAPILVLDEATAFSDMENQQKIQESLRALSKDKTLIIIAHRLATISDCHKIILLDQGKLKACGSHNELLESSDLYRHMWNIHCESESWSVMSNQEVKKC